MRRWKVKRGAVLTAISALIVFEITAQRPVSPNPSFELHIQAQAGSPEQQPTKLSGVLVDNRGSVSRFSAELPPGGKWRTEPSPKVRALVVRADAPGGRSSAAAEILRPRESGEFVLSLKPPFEVRCEVFNLQGEPVERDRATAIVNAASFTGSLGGPSAFTDAAGKCTLSGLPAGLPWQVIVEKPGVGLAYSDPLGEPELASGKPIDSASIESLQMILVPTKAAPGRPAPELRPAAWAQGPAVRLADLKGKVALLDFWALWCRPCLMTMPHVKELHKRYAPAGLAVIGVHDSTATARQVARFLKLMGVEYPVVVDAKPQGNPEGSVTHQAYGALALPSLFLIDRQGIIRWQGHPLSPDLDARLKFLLAD